MTTNTEANQTGARSPNAPPGRPWLAVTIAGAIALALVAAAVPAWFFTGDRIEAVTDSLRLPATNFRVVEGQGEPLEEGLRITAPSNRGVAVIAARFSEALDVERFENLTINLAPPGETAPDLMFLWGPPDSRRPTERHQLSGAEPNIALDELVAWPERVGTLALVLMGPATQGAKIQGFTFEGPPPTALGLYEKIISGWLAEEGWTQYSINLIKGGGGPLIVSPVLVAGGWMVLTVILFAAYRVIRRQGVPAGPVFAVIATAWLLLDARWQYDLTRQHIETYTQFAGVPSEEKVIPEVGEGFMELIQAAKTSLDPNARVLVVSESELFRKYARYRLLPLSSYYRDDFPPSVFRHLQPGDAVLMLGASEATPGGLQPRETPALRARLPRHFGVDSLEPVDAERVDDPDAPGGQALAAKSGGGTFHEGPSHEGPSQGYYRAEFVLRPPEGKTDSLVRLQVLRHQSGRKETTVFAEREAKLDANGYARVPLVFPWPGQGRLGYRVLDAEAGMRSAGVHLSVAENASGLAFVSRDREPPYLVARPIARSDIGLLFRIP